MSPRCRMRKERNAGLFAVGRFKGVRRAVRKKNTPKIVAAPVQHDGVRCGVIAVGNSFSGTTEFLLL